VRAELVLGGGALQIFTVISLWHLEGVSDAGAAQEQVPEALPFFHRMKTPSWSYVWRAALTLAVATAIYRWGSLANGYWFPMTALIVLRSDFCQTLVRGIARTLGTLAGAALATLLVAGLRPGAMSLAVLVLIFAWGSYALLNVNYAAYAVCITSYVVFLLGFAGLPTLAVVEHRSLNTVLGGALALLAYLPLERSLRPHQP